MLELYDRLLFKTFKSLTLIILNWLFLKVKLRSDSLNDILTKTKFLPIQISISLDVFS